MLWDLGEKTTACRKQRFNHLGPQMVWQRQETWALQVEFSSSILHIVCDIIFESSNELHGNEKTNKNDNSSDDNNENNNK